MGGSKLTAQVATYGDLGIAAPSNNPGARYKAAHWTDADGNLWLFGGSAENSASPGVTDLNDLWKYSSGEWTWVSGTNIGNQPGKYGTQGMPAPDNLPGARTDAAFWTDSVGNMWLFGGYGCDSNSPCGYANLNDLWKFSGGEWTWMAGSATANQSGSYGTLGSAAPGNIPGARADAATWTDLSGNLWLFGGAVYTYPYPTESLMSDLWKFSEGEWTWMGGSADTNQPGNSGLLGTPGSNNIPSARSFASGWTDRSGNFWLFGGFCIVGSDITFMESCNDLWQYSDGEWTWVAGPPGGDQPGTYGILGVPSPDVMPGARGDSATWVDSSGNLWLFGGGGYGSTSTWGDLNDLWKLEP